jgi:hypothetical protein
MTTTPGVLLLYATAERRHDDDHRQAYSHPQEPKRLGRIVQDHSEHG